MDSLRDSTGSQKFIHHKYLLIDADNPDSNSVLVTGSTNWSNNGFNYNDANFIVVHDPNVVNLYLQEFMARFQGSGNSG